MSVFTCRTPAFLRAMHARSCKRLNTVACTHCVLLAAHLKFLTFASACDSLHVKWMACNISVVLTTDNGLLAIVLARVTCKRNWLYVAHPASSHAAHWRVKTSMKTPLLGTSTCTMID